MIHKKMVGVDSHKNTIACFVNGKFKEFKTNTQNYKKAIQWAPKNAHWCIEGAYSYGLSFSKFLLDSGCQVFEINALTTSRLRKIDSIAGSKNDYGDAKVISIFANQTNLQPVSLATVELKRKITSRKLFVKQRTELINHLKSYLVMSGKTVGFRSFTTQKSAKYFCGSDDSFLRNSGKMLQLYNESIGVLDKEIEELLPAKALDLEQITGVGRLSAAIIYTELKGKRMSSGQLASYSGVSPVENSSGQTRQHRNNKRGNRILNSIFYQMSLHQSRYDERGRAYFAKKLSEGKTKSHARKCLSRQLVNRVHNILFA